jgi:hypothetical protein
MCAINKSKKMQVTKEGQIVKYHSPLSDENPEQVYVVLEIKYDTESPKADIQALNTGLPVVPVSTVLLDDLEVVEVSTNDLIGLIVKIKKTDSSLIIGKVISIDQPKINLDLSNSMDGVNTNVYLTVLDRDGIIHTGTLFVN